jgi:hypothetical protein
LVINKKTGETKVAKGMAINKETGEMRAEKGMVVNRENSDDQNVAGDSQDISDDE